MVKEVRSGGRTVEELSSVRHQTRLKSTHELPEFRLLMDHFSSAIFEISPDSHRSIPTHPKSSSKTKQKNRYVHFLVEHPIPVYRFILLVFLLFHSTFPTTDPSQVEFRIFYSCSRYVIHGVVHLKTKGKKSNKKE